MASGSSDHAMPMAPGDAERDVTQASPNPLYMTPPPRPIPQGFGHDFSISPTGSTLAGIQSLPDAIREVYQLQQIGSSLPFPPPPLTENPDGISDEEAVANGPSPSIESRLRFRTQSLISNANRAGLKAHSLQCAAKVDGTPARAVTTGDFGNFPMGRGLKAEGEAIVEELGTVLEAHSDDIARFDKPIVNEIKQYLVEASGTWNNKRKRYVGGVWDPTTKTWRLPVTVSLEKEIYPGMVKIIATIMKKFHKYTGGVDRKVIDTHDVRFQHKEDNCTSPDLVIQARGLSFGKPEGADVGYPSIATFIEVKRECDMGGPSAHIKQLGTYVRQMLAYQPNRLFVPCLLVSEKTFRLAHFDRSGVQISPRYNIHTQYIDFIRLIVSLTSPNESDIGFDDTIQWATDDTGRKISGTLKLKIAPSGRMKTYELVDKEPIATHVIKGRATTCWLVRDPKSGKQYVVKDSWTSAERTAEYDLLKKVTQRNLKGVCQLAPAPVVRQTRRLHTKSYRCRTTITSSLFHDRVFSRVVLKAYGKQLQYFTSILQLLSALFDAISGHVELIAGASILHRDINERNVLLGVENAELGWRGVLIDLNAAVDFELKKEASKEARTGSRFFQSLRVLESLSDLTKEVAPAHDYLDDLEAFFYLLCWILLLYLKDGTLRPVDDMAWKVVRGWDSEDVELALNSKSALFNTGRSMKRLALTCIQQEWGQECADLFRKFHEWVGHIQAEKERLLGHFGPQDPKKESIYKPLLNQIISHYTQVLSFFENAIVSLGGTCLNPPSLNRSNDGAGIAKRPRSPVHAPQDEEAGPNPVRPRRASVRLAGGPAV